MHSCNAESGGATHLTNISHATNWQKAAVHGFRAKLYLLIFFSTISVYWLSEQLHVIINGVPRILSLYCNLVPQHEIVL